jgi:Amt family ammonium transporter
MTLFLFQMVFMDTAATIPTGAMAERWKFLAFCIYGVWISAVVYPLFGNWVWGGGWLAKLGANFGLGHGHVDFAGSSVVHMTGGVCALAGVLVLGPRIGKYNKDGTVNVLPAHNVPMYVLGTLILAFGWFGFNPGSTLAGADLNIGRIAANTMLASAAGCCSATAYMWLVYGKPDPSFLCNGLLAGLVAITAPCAFVAPWAAVLIGGIAGVLVVWACLFFERKVKVDDPVGAIGVHGVNGAWGVLALGLFADGTYGQGWNGTFWYKLADGSLRWFPEKLKDLPAGAAEQGVTGLFYGNESQFAAQCIGTLTNVVWVFLSTYVFFRVVDRVIGMRSSREAELQGLDVPELGVLGYIHDDPKAPEGHVLHPPAEPRHAEKPPSMRKRFKVAIEGLNPSQLHAIWTELCQPGGQAPEPEFLALYPHMTTLQGTVFCFRDGDPATVCENLEGLLRSRAKDPMVRVRVIVDA